MARQYWIKSGGHYFPMASLAVAKREARNLAEHWGKRVTVGYDDIPAAKSFWQNPDPGSFLDVWAEKERSRLARLGHLAKTKARRLAKGHRARSAKAAPPTFRVDVNNELEAWTFSAPTRPAANALARQYRAAGYYAEVSEA